MINFHPYSSNWQEIIPQTDVIINLILKKMLRPVFILFSKFAGNLLD
jgi:hypothetical protein